MSVNKWIGIGNLGQDPQINYTQSGGAVANVSVATSERWKDKNTGENKEATEWHRVIFFGRLAEVAGQYLRKGSQIYVEGKLQTRKWTDKQGVERYSTEIVAREMQMLDSRQDNQQSNPHSQQPQNQVAEFDTFEDFGEPPF